MGKEHDVKEAHLAGIVRQKIRLIPILGVKHIIVENQCCGGHGYDLCRGFWQNPFPTGQARALLPFDRGFSHKRAVSDPDPGDVDG